MLLQNMIKNGQIQGEPLEISPGTCLFEPGKPNKGFYFLTEGTALFSQAGGTEEKIMPGKLLGLPDLMHEQYHFKVYFEEPAKAIFIPKEEMLHALQLHTALRFYFMQQLSRYTTQNIDAYE
ncbi:Crp/Fnr family transcriptional regulator [Pontibacter sp. Tf4]|uniref:cyclic nucleotide-binding domain-containing protein n=1 Tax=Pontibacter sp. Tf4 TaxID=2761620 RepID=UPI0016285D81|nr:cyclic nucleotide-binding domain-containing protein [Pontibacter sp. Tf4]MBB6610355.1 Crp/Fnr family transcriptional regulator [Pontibacter sp. Tf4]